MLNDIVNKRMVKKKVLIGLTYYFPYISGLSQYAKLLAEGLVKDGYRVEIITSKFENKLEDYWFEVKIPDIFREQLRLITRLG